jgi:hypothetical protein
LSIKNEWLVKTGRYKFKVQSLSLPAEGGFKNKSKKKRIQGFVSGSWIELLQR